MTKPLRVLVITHNNDSIRSVHKFRQNIADLFPKRTEIQYSVYGIARGDQVQADRKKYDLVIMSPIIANHFNTPSVLDRKYTK